jgi:hypothetical protein
MSDEIYPEDGDILDRLVWWQEQDSMWIWDGEDAFVDNVPIEDISGAVDEIWRLNKIISELRTKGTVLSRLLRNLDDIQPAAISSHDKAECERCSAWIEWTRAAEPWLDDTTFTKPA